MLYEVITTKAHQSQFWLTPPVLTMSVTRFGVSVEKVVATMEVPRSHQGSFLPARKNSSVPWPARRAKYRPTTRTTRPYSPTTTQSDAVNCMTSPFPCRYPQSRITSLMYAIRSYYEQTYGIGFHICVAGVRLGIDL